MYLMYENPQKTFACFVRDPIHLFFISVLTHLLAAFDIHSSGIIKKPVIKGSADDYGMNIAVKVLLNAGFYAAFLTAALASTCLEVSISIFLTFEIAGKGIVISRMPLVNFAFNWSVLTPSGSVNRLSKLP